MWLAAHVEIASQLEHLYTCLPESLLQLLHRLLHLYFLHTAFWPTGNALFQHTYSSEVELHYAAVFRLHIMPGITKLYLSAASPFGQACRRTVHTEEK